MTTYTVIGQPVGHTEGPEKVTGRAVYPADLSLPGMLWAKVLRSPFPHARIRSIDTSRARDLPGVHAVLTAADLPDVRVGRMVKDIPLLARDRVLFVGDKVAVVAAEDQDIAEEALLLIEVDYEELPAVFDPVQAVQSDAPVLHEDFGSYEMGRVPLHMPPGTSPPADVSSNLFSRRSSSKGDIEDGFAQADLVFEHTFTLPMVHQAYLEPHACVVHIDDQDRVQVWANNKTPHVLRQQLADAVGLALEHFRVNVAYIGGDFGGKGGPLEVPLIYFLAKATGRPVKHVRTYMEEFMASNPRHPGVITIRSGVMRDGTLVARQVKAVWNSGAYAGFKPAGSIPANEVPGPYRIPHVYVEADCVYTNTEPRGHARAPGGPQAVFAGESHMDMIAKELGMDPLEFRLKNVLQEGDASPLGHEWHDVRAEEMLRAAAKAIGWDNPKAGPNVGRGLALFDHPIGSGTSSATVAVEADGSAVLYSPTFDTGTGIHTILRQLVAEELTLPLERVGVVTVNTDEAPADAGIGGSRVTNVAGQAALQAVQQVRQRLTEVAAELLEVPQDRVRLRAGQFTTDEAGGPSISLTEVAAIGIAQGGPVSAHVAYQGERAHVTSFCAEAAEVEVDPETGQVTLQKFIVAVDSGTILNPITYQGQIAGGAVFGLGYALMEEMPVEEGRVQTVHFGDYKIPTMRDIPQLTTIFIEEGEGPTPYQGKAVGETANCPVAAAVANAVADAVGARITALPVTAEKVLAALKSNG